MMPKNIMADLIISKDHTALSSLYNAPAPKLTVISTLNAPTYKLTSTVSSQTELIYLENSNQEGIVSMYWVVKMLDVSTNMILHAMQMEMKKF